MNKAYVLAFSSVVCLMTGDLMAQTGKEKELTGVVKALCPVGGETVDFFCKAATDEGPVFFCCTDCIGTFEKDKAKYAKETAAQRKALETMTKVQVICPVTGDPADLKISADHEGKKVYFATPEAMSQFQAEPAKFKAKLANAFTFQAKCPVMDKPIDPKRFVDLKGGQRVFLCCGRCDGKFFTDSAKSAEKLKAQGYPIDAAAIVKK